MIRRNDHRTEKYPDLITGLAGEGIFFIGQKPKIIFVAILLEILLPSPTAIPAINDLLTHFSDLTLTRKLEMEYTYNIASIEVGTCITGHPYNGALELRRVPESSHRNIFHPPLLDMPTFFCKKIDNEVSFHVARAQAVDSDSLWSPLEASKRLSRSSTRIRTYLCCKTSPK